MTLSYDKHLFIENIYRNIKNMDLDNPLLNTTNNMAFVNVQSYFNSFYDTLMIYECETCNKKLNIMIYGFGESNVIKNNIISENCIFCKDQFIRENLIILEHLNLSKRSRFN